MDPCTCITHFRHRSWSLYEVSKDIVEIGRRDKGRTSTNDMRPDQSTNGLVAGRDNEGEWTIAWEVLILTR